jgi:hypothetical protein
MKDPRHNDEEQGSKQVGLRKDFILLTTIPSLTTA